MCTDDDNADANNANDRQSMVAKGLLVDKPNEPKNNSFFQHPIDIILRTGRPISLLMPESLRSEALVGTSTFF